MRDVMPPYLLLKKSGHPEGQKSGQFMCYKTGQFSLLLTVHHILIDKSINI
jgi:hypothetical protein